MSHRSFRSSLALLASGLAAVIAISGAIPALAATRGAPTGSVPPQEWWLPALHVTQTWPTTEGAGITVAVLSTGVAGGHPDLSGSVITGPDYTGSGRAPGSPFWGVDGTAVASIIAGHGHGQTGFYGVAPMAKILSVRVNLEFNDPLNSDQATARRLPGAIAEGITYAVNHGVRIIDLPIDPGTLGLTGRGDPAAAGGSPAERAAVNYALSKNVVLVAPAGNDGQGPGLVNYPAAYYGVIAVGAVSRDGQVAPFSSRRSYVTLTAPGENLLAATPPDGYAQISSTSTASGVVAGVAALVLSRFPHLSAVQVTQALIGSTAVTPATTARTGAPGAGHGTVDATRAVNLAAAMVSAAQARQTAAPQSGTQRPAPPARAAPHQANAGSLAGSLIRYIVAGLGVLIALLVGLLLVMRSRRAKARAAAAADRGRPRGQHEHRKPEPPSGPGLPLGPAGPAGPAGLARVTQSKGFAWQAPSSWTGGGLGEMASSAPAEVRPVITPAPKPARAPVSSTGPPWSPAPEPEHVIGPLPPKAPNSAQPDAGVGIRVPGDMTALPASAPPAPFDFASADPDFPPRPALADGSDFPTHPNLPAYPNLPTRQSLDFAAAPVPTDYAPPRAPDFTVPSRAAGFVLSADPSAPGSGSGGSGSVGSGSGAGDEPGRRATPAAADPSYIWDLAATDVFPVATDGAGKPEAPGAVHQDDDPGASGS